MAQQSVEPSLVVQRPMSEPFVNVERAYALMEANGVDAIVVRMPSNVYYLTSYRPPWWKETFETAPVAIMTRRPQDSIALVTSAQTYYYMYADSRPTYPYAYYLYSGPDPAAPASLGEAPGALTPQPYQDLGFSPLHAVEAWRAEALGAAVGAIAPSADESWALRKALRDLGLGAGRIAVDDPALVPQVAAAAPGAQVVLGDNLIRRIRQVKTPAAIAAGKLAAQANADAARAAALSTARPGATYRELRAAFYRETAVRGGAPVGFLINMVSSPFFDAEFKEGDAFFIDAVSEYQLCHGDYGRTICIGEPARGMKRATEASQLGWRAIRDSLKPGLRYSEIRAIGEEALRRDGYDVNVKFTAHCVGLAHTEDPYRRDLPFFLEDTALEPGMVLSVDCPVVNAGYGGSCHLEDLVVITEDGHSPLNEIVDPVIMV